MIGSAYAYTTTAAFVRYSVCRLFLLKYPSLSEMGETPQTKVLTQKHNFDIVVFTGLHFWHSFVDKWYSDSIILPVCLLQPKNEQTQHFNATTII